MTDIILRVYWVFLFVTCIAFIYCNTTGVFTNEVAKEEKSLKLVNDALLRGCSVTLSMLEGDKEPTAVWTCKDGGSVYRR